MTLDTEPNDDNFSAAFDRLAELGETNTKSDNNAMKDAAPAADNGADAGDADAGAADDGAGAGDDGAGADAGAADDGAGAGDDGAGGDAGDGAGAAAQDDEDLLNRLASLVKKAPAAAEPEPATQPAATAEPEPTFSQEEQDFLQEYERDWPDVARAEQLRRRAEYRDLVGYVFAEVAKELSPIMEMVQSISTRTHLQDLQEVVTDYDDVRDKVIDWVATQPTYLQSAYNHVIQSGTVDEVADLINRYKEASGVQIKPAGASKKETELPTATKQAAAALAPVSSKRSAVIQSGDPSDFESAFESFADKL